MLPDPSTTKARSKGLLTTHSTVGDVEGSSVGLLVGALLGRSVNCTMMSQTSDEISSIAVTRSLKFDTVNTKSGLTAIFNNSCV